MNHSEIRVASGRSTLPSDWEVPEIDELLEEISMGPFGSDIKVDNFVSAGVPVLNGSNLRSHKLTGPFRNFVTAEKAKALKKAVASKGDIVVTHRGTLGQVAYIPDELEHERFVVSQSQFRARFDRSKVDPRWVPLYFLSTQGQAALLEKKGHTGVPAISSPTKTFRALRLPLPAIHEQRRIVAAINDVEAEIEGLERLIAKKRDIKRAAMQQLLAGKTRLPGFTAAWDTKSIGEIADIVSGGTPKTSEPAYWNGSVLWCTPTDITAIPGKYLTSTERRITELGVRISGARLLPPGALLLCSRATIGECKIASRPTTTNQGFKSLICRSGAHNEFLYYKILTLKNMLLEKSFGSTFLEISKANLASIPLDMPPLEEQLAIAEALSDMDLELDFLRARLAKTKAIKQGMMQQLLTGKVRLA